MAVDATAITGRVPPGQNVTQKWPVLHYGSVPAFNPLTWDFRIFGLVEEPRTLTYQEFMALPRTTLTCDIHCVTTMRCSPTAPTAPISRPSTGGRCAWWFPACIFGKAQVGTRHRVDGEDRAGFWERNGYHMHGDPWKEERYSSPW